MEQHRSYLHNQEEAQGTAIKQRSGESVQTTKSASAVKTLAIKKKKRQASTVHTVRSYGTKAVGKKN